MRTEQLPFVDDHSVTVAASADEVWRALLETVERSASRRTMRLYARLVGCSEREASGSRPLTAGATVPAFRVVAAVPRRELVLLGHHRFSSYMLAFRLKAVEQGRVRLHAASWAAFPGLRGAVYRAMVIGTGAHVWAVLRLLSAVRRHVEHLGPPAGS